MDDAAWLGSLLQNRQTAAADSTALQRITADSFVAILLIIVGIGAARRRLVLGLAAAFAAGISVLLTDFLKYDVLTRPHLTLLVPASSNTFPSGHTATAVACAMALVLIAPPRWKGVATVIAGGYAWLTAAQVQTAGWHRPSDAIGAALLAFAVVCAVGGILAWTRRVSWVPRAGRHLVAQGILAAGGAVTAALTTWGAVNLPGHLGLSDLYRVAAAGTWNTAYITGVSFTVFVVLVVLMALLRLVGRADFDAR